MAEIKSYIREQKLLMIIGGIMAIDNGDEWRNKKILYRFLK